MKKRFKCFIGVLALSLLVSGCAGAPLEFNTVEKTAQLRPGMTHEDVVKLLGKPKSVQFTGDKVMLKYSLHEYWKGWVPYYVIFNKGTGKLIEWYADEAEYQRKQAMWMSVFQEFEKAQQAEEINTQQGGTDGSGAYMEGYDPNANYYTDDYYWEGSGFHYDD